MWQPPLPILLGRRGNGQPKDHPHPTSPPCSPPHPRAPGHRRREAVKPSHHPCSLGCYCFHSSLLVITKEKTKTAPLGFTSHVRGEFYKPLWVRRRGAEGREAERQCSGTRTGYLGCQQGAHGRSVERTQVQVTALPNPCMPPAMRGALGDSQPPRHVETQSFYEMLESRAC